jgi:hypothetical protein
MNAFSHSDYTGSGGRSRVIRLPGSDQLTVELHPDSFTLLWSSFVDASRWATSVPLLAPARPGTAIVFAQEDAEPRAMPSYALAPEIATAAEAPVFVRLDYDDRVLTWEPKHEDTFGAVAVLTNVVDTHYFQRCLKLTGTPAIAAAASALVREAWSLVERFPAGQLMVEEDEDEGTPMPS